MRVWLSNDRLVLVTLFEDGTMTVAMRPSPDAIWGPPIRLVEERVT